MSVPSTPAPRIPPPPLNAMRRRARDGRWVIWPFMLVLGVIVGTAFYQWVPLVRFYCDYWVTLALR